MNNYVFAWTEFQQKTVYSIVSQNNIEVDVLFLREGVAENKRLSSLARRVVLLPDIKTSFRFFIGLESVIQKLVIPTLCSGERYAVYTWTTEHPYVRSLIFKDGCREVNLFEDGTGSYVNVGRFNQKHGFRALLSTVLLRLIFWRYGGLRIEPNCEIKGWSLFPGAYPRINTSRVKLDHEVLKSSLREFVVDAPLYQTDLHDGAAVYIPSPFADCNLMTQDEEVSLHVSAIEKLSINYDAFKFGPIFWKPHPRADIDKELERVKAVSSCLEVDIVVLDEAEGLEVIALRYEDLNILFASLASTSLYVLKALDIEKHNVLCVNSSELARLIPGIKELVAVLEGFDIQVLR